MSIESNPPSGAADSSGTNLDFSCRAEEAGDADLSKTSAPVGEGPQAGKQRSQQAAMAAVVKVGAGRLLGDFELLREIGRGGMGVVYEARQRSLNKRVAVKVLPFSAMLDKRAVKRFQTEAWAAAQLQHRNIVPVYQVGSENDVYFYAMQYINGGDLHDLFRSLREAAFHRRTGRVAAAESTGPQQTVMAKADDVASKPNQVAVLEDDSEATVHPPSQKKRESTHRSGWSKGDTLASQNLLEQVAKHRSTSVPQFLSSFVNMGIQVADALHYAHEMGIVHRDIKPSNLLLDTDGDVWIADFGLAQIADAPGMTATGEIIGTRRYMSPEQAMGKRVGVDHRTDIYSLGVTFYELLTLRPAFEGVSREDIMRKITFDDPIRPRKIDRRIPEDLETIVMKAISKNPDDRYQTAAELAEDFRLFREDKPIKGRRPSISKQMVRWGRRHRSVVAAVGLMTLTTFISAILIAYFSWNLYAVTAVAFKSEQEKNAEIQGLLRQSDGLRLSANSQLELDDDPSRALLLAVEAGLRYPGVDTNQAILDALDALHEFKTLSGHVGPVGHLAFNDDGTKLISSVIRSRFDSGPDPAILWDVTTGKAIGELKDEKSITSTAVSPDKFRILTTSSPPAEQATDDLDGELVGLSPSLWDSLNFERLVTFKDAFLFEAHPAVFDPEGRRAVCPSLGHTATIYDCVAGHDLIPLVGHEKRVVFAAFSPQGDRVVTASDDNTVRVWNAETGDQIYAFDHWKKRSPNSQQCVIESVAFRADGRQLVTGSRELGVHLWDLTNGDRVNDEHLKGEIAEYGSNGLQLLTHLFTGADVVIRDVSEGKAIRILKPERGRVRQSVMSPSGQWIAIRGDSDSTKVSIWNAASGQVEAVLKGHPVIVNDVAFSPNSELIATASSDKTVKLWHVANGRDRATYPTRGLPEDLLAAASPGGKQLAIVDQNPISSGRVVSFEEPEKGLDRLPRISMPKWASNRFITTKGSRLAVHSVEDGAELASIRNGTGSFRAVAINLDGDRVAAFGGDQAITLWFPDENRQLPLPVGTARINSLGFNPAGDRLVSVGADGYARVWNADTGQLLASLQNDANVLGMVFRSDGKQFATVTDQNRGIVWDTESFQNLVTLESAEASFSRLEYNFDGSKLISFHSTESRAVCAWDAKTGDLKSSFEVTGEVHVAMHPARNEALVTSTKDGAAIWQFDQNTRLPVTDEPMIHGAFSFDGSQFVIATAVDFPNQPWQMIAAPQAPTPSVLQRWGHDELKRLDSLEFPSENIRDFDLSRDGRVFANAALFFSIVNYDVATHEPTCLMPGHGAQITDCRFTSDSERLVTSSWDQRILVWDAADGHVLKTLSGHGSAIYCLAISEDDRWVLSGADNGQCILWDLESGEMEQRIELAQSTIQHVAFNAAGDQMLAITSDHALHLYDLKAKKSVDLAVGVEQIAWAEFSPDGASLLVVPHSTEQPVVDGVDRQDNAIVNQRVLIVPVNGNTITPIIHDGSVVTAHFDRSGTKIISATSNGTVTLRDVKTGRVERNLSRPGISVVAAVLSDSGGYAAVVGTSEVTLWKVKEALEWISVPRVPLPPNALHQYNPFLGGSEKLVGLRVDSHEYRDWPIEPLEFARGQMPRVLSDREKTRFLIDRFRPKND